LDALLHPEQTETRFAGGLFPCGGQVKSDAIILDEEFQVRATVPHFYANLSGLSVPHHIGQRLLRDAEARRLDVRWRP
jgi:hypothetical protein